MGEIVASTRAVAGNLRLHLGLLHLGLRLRLHPRITRPSVGPAVIAA